MGDILILLVGSIVIVWFSIRLLYTVITGPCPKCHAGEIKVQFRGCTGRVATVIQECPKCGYDTHEFTKMFYNNYG